MNQIKCIVLDIDFTLTKSDGSISDYTKNIIKKAKEKGIYVILCSGRPNIYTVEKSKISNASPIVISDNGEMLFVDPFFVDFDEHKKRFTSGERTHFEE